MSKFVSCPHCDLQVYEYALKAHLGACRADRTFKLRVMMARKFEEEAAHARLKAARRLSRKDKSSL